MGSLPAVQPARVLADLDELARRTGGPEGARRIAWTGQWRAARSFLRERLAELGLAAEEDEAGNLWARLSGQHSSSLVLGSHLDSVPGGGRLDGALGVFAALEVLRTLTEAGEFPETTVALVDWADEEGARFGRSLFGSAAASRRLDVESVRSLADADGVALVEALAAHEIDLDSIATEMETGLDDAWGYLELHIEQGPVLEAEGLPVAAVSGTVGVERFMLRFEGAVAHAGAAPMDLRSDALLAAAATALEVERIAVSFDGRGTTGSLTVAPGALTVVCGEAELGVDLRHGDPAELAKMRAQVLKAAQEFAAGRGCQVAEVPVWSAAAMAFDPELVELVRSSCERAGGRPTLMLSGALHDATEVAAVVPTAMVFCPSIGGASHSPHEDTKEADLRAAIDVFGGVVIGLLNSREAIPSGGSS